MLQEKRDPEATSNFESVSKTCATILAEEGRPKHGAHVMDKMAKSEPGHKQWWKINRERLHRKGTLSSIPTLRENGKWIRDAKEKANLRRRTLKAKTKFPEELVDTLFLAALTMDQKCSHKTSF